MTSKLLDLILRAQLEVRRRDNRMSKEDIERQRQEAEVLAMKWFADFHLKMGTGYEIQPKVEWSGTSASATFAIDGQDFTVIKDGNNIVLLVLLAGNGFGAELARVTEKKDWGYEACTRFLSAVGDFLGISASDRAQ